MSSSNNTKDDAGEQGNTSSRITKEAIQNVSKYLPNEGDKKRAEQEITKDRKFWDNQPVPKICKFHRGRDDANPLFIR